MKGKNKIIPVILSLFILTSCSNYRTKSIDEMNVKELNQYKDYLESKNKALEEDINEYLEYYEDNDVSALVDMINEINNEVVKSNVMITNESKSLFHTTSVSSGSGTIIKEENNKYYVLTNNHVIYTLGRNSSYFVYDYLNNEYNATLLFYDPNYDLALLSFDKDNELRVSKIAKENIGIGKGIVTIGQPMGQRNAITFGKTLKYDYVDCSSCKASESNINYECLYYSANTNHGNSGGMVINYDYEMVGVVTFGLSNANGEYVNGAGSPVAKIREFLANNHFEVGDENE